MARIIIGVHGLGNKPPVPVLKEWWLKAIHEGLTHIGHPGIFFRFELVYWADVFHPRPLDPFERDKKSPNYIEYPYVPAIDFSPRPPSKLRRRILEFLEKKMDRIFSEKKMSSSFNSVSDLIIKYYFKDLDNYYSSMVKIGEKEISAKEVIRNRLLEVLKKHRDKEILLLAHSMGTIISYEVLTLHQKDIMVDTLVTAGSPLGQPIVLKKFFSELYQDLDQSHQARVPESIKHKWYNLADLEDNITVNYNLKDNFQSNSSLIGVTDKTVYNNYSFEGKRNPHKSYGYLRTDEMANIINDFLSRDRSKLGFWLINRWLEFSQRFKNS